MSLRPAGVYVLPWLGDINGPITIGDVTFYSKADGRARLAEDLRAGFDAATAGFYDDVAMQNAMRTLRDLRAASAAADRAGDEASVPERGSTFILDVDSPAQLLASALQNLSVPQSLEPVVAFTSTLAYLEDGTPDPIATATLVWSFLAVAQRDRYSSVNSAAFQVFRYMLGASSNPDFIVDVTPTMFGRMHNAFYAYDAVRVRPAHAGELGHVDLSIAAPLYCAAMQDEHIRDALQAFSAATSESPDVPADLQHSLFAKAATDVIYTTGSDKAPVLEQTRLCELLDPLLGAPSVSNDRLSKGESARHAITRAWYSARSARNNYWHAGRIPRVGYRFERQLLVAPAVIGLRMMWALTIARMIELGFVDADSKLAREVEAVEMWIEHLGPELEVDLAAAGTPLHTPEGIARNEACKRAASLAPFRTKVAVRHGVARLSTEAGLQTS